MGILLITDMKVFKLLLIVVVLGSCKNKVLIDKIPLAGLPRESYIKKNFLDINFEIGFDNTLIKIYDNSNLIFLKRITTIDQIGYAANYSFTKEVTSNISIVSKEDSLIINNAKKYEFITIGVENGKLKSNLYYERPLNYTYD